LIQRFEAGFVAGAQTVNPNIEIAVQYITEPPNFDGFNDPASAKVIAQTMYDGGADIVYHAAGGSGAGLFEAAKEFSEASGSKVWAIGVDSDQYLTASEDVQEFVLTSMLKRVDVSIYDTIAAANGGECLSGIQEFNLNTDGVGYSTSGGFVDDIADQLDDFRQQIIDGEIQVPSTP
jgi:basic membrane protein A